MLKLTTKDICAALGVPKHRVRGWTRLPPFCDRPVHARSARRYDPLDLLLMAIVQSLEDVYGVRSSVLLRATPAIMRFLCRPRESHHDAIVYLDILKWEMQVMTPGLPIQAGFIIDVERERRRVAEFLGLRHVQGDLPLGLVVVNQARL